MSKHTPGPWRIIHAEKHRIMAFGPDNEHGTLIQVGFAGLHISGTSHKARQSIAAANAQLIAAAPDLLGALKKIILENPTGNGFPGYTEALVAIAKAEGKE